VDFLFHLLSENCRSSKSIEVLLIIVTAQNECPVLSYFLLALTDFTFGLVLCDVFSLSS